MWAGSGEFSDVVMTPWHKDVELDVFEVHLSSLRCTQGRAVAVGSLRSH